VRARRSASSGQGGVGVGGLLFERGSNGLRVEVVEVRQEVVGGSLVWPRSSAAETRRVLRVSGDCRRSSDPGASAVSVSLSQRAGRRSGKRGSRSSGEPVADAAGRFTDEFW
jgi:hypothetical protein